MASEGERKLFWPVKSRSGNRGGGHVVFVDGKKRWHELQHVKNCLGKKMEGPSSLARRGAAAVECFSERRVGVKHISVKYSFQHRTHPGSHEGLEMWWALFSWRKNHLRTKTCTDSWCMLSLYQLLEERKKSKDQSWPRNERQSWKLDSGLSGAKPLPVLSLTNCVKWWFGGNRT